MACGALVSNLRAPSTVTDGLAHVLDVLAVAGAGALPAAGVQVAALRDAHAGLRRRPSGSLGGCADPLRALAVAPAHPVAADLRLGWQVTLSGRVADEAAAAAGVLARLGPHPRGTAGWRDYHARFLERYGLGAVVSARDLADPVAGLGLPARYAGLPEDTPAPTWSGRDVRLAALAQQAALDGTMEVVLGDAGIAALAGLQAGPVRPVRTRTSPWRCARRVPRRLTQARSRSWSAAPAARRWPHRAGSFTCCPATSTHRWPGPAARCPSGLTARSRRSCRSRRTTRGRRTSPGFLACCRTC